MNQKEFDQLLDAQTKHLEILERMTTVIEIYEKKINKLEKEIVNLDKRLNAVEAINIRFN